MKTPATHIQRPTPDAPILLATDAAAIGIRAGTVITIEGISRTFETDTHIPFSNPTVGRDYGIGFDSDGNLCAEIVDQNPLSGKFFAGFHFAPGGNAVGRDGGDSEPAINPYSIWDIGFRPSCPDPRGMTRVQCTDGKSIWVDIYFLGVNHAEHDTSRFGETIANGDTMGLLDYQTTVKIIEGHGKRLLTYDEFRAAAYGVTERSSADRNPKKTGLDAARTSRFGMMQATGKALAGLEQDDNFRCLGTHREARRRIREIYNRYEAKQVAFDAREHRDGGHVDRLVAGLAGGAGSASVK